ncbi:MAG: thiamine-phosphate kinase [Pseudomonadota bacterium]
MSEFEWIKKYFAPLATISGAAGLTDDVAQISPANRIITADALVEAVHFLPSDPIDTVARKLVRVNVSDVLAKGAKPAEALLTLGWPRTRTEDQLKRFADAFGEELAKWGIDLVGGDTVTSPSTLFVSLTLTGTLPDGAKPIRRFGAKPGDIIWISGEIGWGGAGLTAARNREGNEAAARYRVPEIPSIAIAETILSHASASMDVSDGLIADLTKLLAASGCGAAIALDTVLLAAPVDPDSLKAVLGAVTAGDDYQCLFTAPPEVSGDISAAGLQLTQIGSVTENCDLDLKWRGKPVLVPARTGFEHK